MKNLIFLLSMLVTGFVSLPASALERDVNVATQLNLASQNSMQTSQLGTQLVYGTARTLKCQIKFSRQGGALATPLILQTVDGAVCRLPAKAIVLFGLYEASGSPTSLGGATISLSTGQSAGDLLAPTAISSLLVSSGRVALSPVYSAASSIKISAETQPYALVGTAALTAGTFNVFITYVNSD